ncbi:hypothetical protein JS533_011660 [Bifidobacterium amazonense]|uniref:Uncharacterized protein n=1 Tax=Bifidobacterium amazonense TaxID=2809027 RepID=A0ABS9VXT6_9BIFI|nr:hypothetical protein [Bifidobacterium amazonense]MCH9276916.1 hypothetical protein [Bifidobacterium amazonense]
MERRVPVPGGVVAGRGRKVIVQPVPIGAVGRVQVVRCAQPMCQYRDEAFRLPHVPFRCAVLSWYARGHWPVVARFVGFVMRHRCRRPLAVKVVGEPGFVTWRAVRSGFDEVAVGVPDLGFRRWAAVGRFVADVWADGCGERYGVWIDGGSLHGRLCVAWSDAGCGAGYCAPRYLVMRLCGGCGLCDTLVVGVFWVFWVVLVGGVVGVWCVLVVFDTPMDVLFFKGFGCFLWCWFALVAGLV